MIKMILKFIPNQREKRKVFWRKERKAKNTIVLKIVSKTRKKIKKHHNKNSKLDSHLPEKSVLFASRKAL